MAQKSVRDPTEAVRSALRIAYTYIGFYDRLGIPIPGSRVLELGPGKNFGSVLVLQCLGAQVAVADKYMTAYDLETHPIFYRALADAVERIFPSADVAQLRQIADQKRYLDSAIELIHQPCENLSTVPSQIYDLVLSNAVMEHLVDPAKACRELFRIMKPGAYGVHQIDYRDHRNFDRPLEYLFMEESKFQRLFKEVHGTCGNRFRARHFRSFFEDAGFVLDATEHNMFSTPDYFAKVVRRAEKVGLSYCDEDLRVLSGRVYVAKPPQGVRRFESSLIRSGREINDRFLQPVRPKAEPLRAMPRPKRILEKVVSLLQRS